MEDVTNIQMNTKPSTDMSKTEIEIIKFKKIKEKEEFYQRLVEFHRHKNVNSPIINFPTINGKLVDLRKLYNIVISFGGWERVCEKDKWNDIAIQLDEKLFKSCLNGSQALKTIYIRYLNLYEKFDYHMSYGTNLNQGASLSSLLDPLHNFNNPSLPHAISANVLNPNSSFANLDKSNLGYHKNSVPNLEDTIDSDINRRKFSYLLDLTPSNYTYSQHNPNHSHNTSYLNPNPYEKLEISLISGLPNEVDFVFNTIVLLTSDEANAFKIYQAPRLVNLLLAHVGFFGEVDKYNLRPLYENYWFKTSKKEQKSKEELFDEYLQKDDLEMLSEKYQTASTSMCSRNFFKFWNDYVQIPDEDFGQKKLLKDIIPKVECNNLPCVDILNLKEIRDDITDSILPNSMEYKRIEQILIVFNNLSFEEINADFMANKCQVLFEFLIMCLYCTNPNYEIRKHALDILANLSRKLKLKTLDDKHRNMILNAMYHVIIGQEELQYFTLEGEEEESIVKIVPILERLDLIRGLEILTKLCCQEQLDALNDEESVNNEKLIAKFTLEFKNGESVLLLQRIFLRLNEILAVQDILILLHSLEFIYNITQFNQFICNLIMDCCSSQSENGQQCKLITVLINFLSLDMSHFGVSNSDMLNQIKMYKVMPSNGQVIAVAPSTQIVNNNTISSNINNTNSTIQVGMSSPVVQNNQKTNSLLQQTLNNQHNSTPKLQFQPQSVVSTIKIQPGANNEQQAKNILCNWLVTCFQTDPNSELSKAQLYPYYQQISKYNNWPVLTIPTFFEILNATFPNLRYEEDSNKIHGLKLVLNLKQQLELKQKFANIRSDSIPIQLQNQSIQQSTLNVQINQKQDELTKNSLQFSPPPSVSINIPTPSINMPLLTPPPPVEDTLKIENDTQDKTCVLTNGTSKTNVLSSQSKETLTNGDEVMGQNEDSLMSNSSSATSQVSASNSTTSTKDAKTDEKSNKENDFNSTRKVELKEPVESKTLAKIFSESSQDSKSDSNTSSPIKKKKLKINEMEEFMNKPMAPITIVSNQYSNTIQVQFKTDITPQQPITQPMPQQIVIPPVITHTAQAIPQTIPQTIPQQVVQQIPQNIQIVQINQIENQQTNGNYLCEWNNCNRYFSSSKAVYNHVCKNHLFNNYMTCDLDGQLCLWSGCDQVKRQKWSLVNHLQERHCSENAMKNAMICRQQGIVKSVNNQNVSNGHLNYSKDAAFYAIQRHHRLKKEDFLSQPEGPITKSIRLLSALTLRNLARNSEKAKILIKNYESQLACVAFDLMESSNAISSCLWHLSH